MRTTSLLALAAALVAGCATQQPSNVDANHGRAVNAAKAAQVVDPDAPSRRRPVAGIDGEAARTAVDMYERSMSRQTAPTSILNIGIGTSTGTTGATTGTGTTR